MSCFWTSYWALEETRISPSVFFRELPHHLPEATSLYIEGFSIAEDVKQVLLNHAQAGPYLPGSESHVRITGAPGTNYFRCEFSPSLLSELERLSELHAEPEICDHLLVYAGSEPILEFYDFPQNEIWLPITVNEERVCAMASALNMAYRKEDNS
jgi:hypothetical protein